MTEEAQHSNNSGGFISLVLVVLVGWWVYNAWLKPEYWQGTYELPSDNIVHATDKFESREQCQEWLDLHIPPGSYSRECGKNCKPPETTIGVYTCEETFAAL